MITNPADVYLLWTVRSIGGATAATNLTAAAATAVELLYNLCNGFIKTLANIANEVGRRIKANPTDFWNVDLFWSTVNYGFHYQYMHNTLQLNRGVFNGDKPFFSNVSRLSGISSTDWSGGPLFADFDNDGWKDIFISNGTRREINHRDYFNELKLRPMAKDSLLYYSQNIPSEPISNFIFQNNKDLSFSDVTEKWGLDYKNFSNGTAYADLDNDGDLEIIVNNIDQEAQIFNNNSFRRTSTCS